MPRCERTINNPRNQKYGQRCSRQSVTGSQYCHAHGGMTDTERIDDVRKRVDRPAQQCTAKRSDGERCQRYAIKGGKVCPLHGGSLPNVKEAAAKRFQNYVDPLLGIVDSLIEDAGLMSYQDRMRLATFLADRVGIGPKSEVVVDAKWEAVADRIIKKRPSEPVRELEASHGPPETIIIRPKQLEIDAPAHRGVLESSPGNEEEWRAY